jgi:hypothetical protein
MMFPPGKYLPWTQRPASEKGAYDLPTSNVEIAGIQRGHVVPDTQRICRDIRAECRENKHERCEECASAIVPLVDELEWIPENLAIESDACARDCNPDEAGQCETNRNCNELNILTGSQFSCVVPGYHCGKYHARSFVLRISLSFAVTYRGVCMGYKVLTVKSGILTPAVAKNPIALLKALSHAHESSLLPKVAFGARRGLFGGTLTNAHISRANHIGGTKIAFAKNSGRIFWGETNMKGN